jgi:acyl-[acyl-carrier-protein]-phospholipid O-acyltransferase/long-chain-fatty-acid--[acyl-carrier-protein] ligase
VPESEPALVSASRLVTWAEGFPTLAAVLPLLGFVALVALCGLWPYGPFRLLLWLATRSFFWLRVRGAANVPARGAALMVCNVGGPLDWLLLVAAHRRRIRCVILAEWTRRWGFRHLLRWSGAITLDAPAGPAEVEHALGRAADALGRGELVCLFTEGWRTRDGTEVRFHRAYEHVTGRHRVPVIPVSLALPRGNLMAVVRGRLVRKPPQEIPCPAEVSFGQPMPADTPAAEARQAVQQLSADAAVARKPRRLPVHRLFVRMAARRPFHSCFIDASAPGRDLNYARGFVAASCLARLLKPIASDTPVVALWLPPSTGGALVNIALAFLGKTSVNLNYSSSQEAVRSALRQCNCRLVITSRRFTARMPLDPGPGVELLYAEDLIPKITTWNKLRALLAVVLLPGWVLDRWVMGLGKHGPDDLATVVFSSGSTGEPKGVMLTHDNIAGNVESTIQHTGLEPRDRALVVLPFFHSFGYTVALWSPLTVGASAVYYPDPRQAKEIGELCRKHACTIYLSTATFLRFCLKKCGADDFRSLRILVCGAEKLPPALTLEFQSRFGVLPVEGYGCTELSPTTNTNMPDEEYDGFTQVRNRLGTVGPPLPGVVGRVIDPDTLELLPLGSEGLLMMYGPNVMKGYLDRPDLTAKVMRDGWYVTGDMARVDADGFVTLTGRLSRFAKVGGEMVPLERIEAELHDILDTGERVCVVSCVPCASRGERVLVLYVAGQLSQHGRDLRGWCDALSDRGLPNLWVPGERDFFAVAELPLLGSGKVDLKGCKDLALQLVQR